MSAKVPHKGWFFFLQFEGEWTFQIITTKKDKQSFVSQPLPSMSDVLPHKKKKRRRKPLSKNRLQPPVDYLPDWNEFGFVRNKKCDCSGVKCHMHKSSRSVCGFLWQHNYYTMNYCPLCYKKTFARKIPPNRQIVCGIVVYFLFLKAKNVRL